MQERFWQYFKFLLYPVQFLAGTGFLLVIIATISSFLDFPILPQLFPQIFFPGIFIVWVPTIIVSGRMTRNTNRRDFWKIAMSGCPIWMKRGLILVGIYAALNFACVIFGLGRTTDHISEIRSVSGHLLVFYGVSFATMYSALHAPQLMMGHTCPLGHTVSPMDQFCPACGKALHS